MKFNINLNVVKSKNNLEIARRYHHYDNVESMHITLKDDLGITATPNDILDSPYDVEIVEMAAESIPVNLSDMDLGVANGNNALNANVLDKLIVTEDAGGVAQQFANVIAVRDGEQDSQKIKDLLSVLKSQKTIDFINEKYDGIVVPFFTVEGE